MAIKQLSTEAYNRLIAQAQKQGISADKVSSTVKGLGATVPGTTTPGATGVVKNAASQGLQPGYALPKNTATPTTQSRTDIFGDVGQVGQVGATDSGIKLSTGDVLKAKPTEIKELGALGVFGDSARQAESQTQGTLEKRNDLIAGNLVAQGKGDVAGITEYLMQQEGFKNSSEQDKQNTIRAIQERIGRFETEAPTQEVEDKSPGTRAGYYIDGNGNEVAILGYGDLDPDTQRLIDGMSDAEKKMLDMQRGNDANAKAEYLRQTKRQQEYLKGQRDLTIKIQDLEGNTLEIQASRRLQDAAQNLDNLKQNYAYLGQMGAPGVSSQKLEAVSRHIADSEKKFAELKQIEQNVAQIRALGLEIDTEAFEKQMADIADDLNMKVGAQIQNALNDMTAADLAGQLDTIDGVTQFKRALLEKMDANISGFTEGSMRQMQFVTEQYTKIADDAQLRITEYNKNANTINTDMSIAQGFYVDGNGNAVVDTAGNPIQMPTKPPMDPVFDKETGKLITFSAGANGQITANVQQVMSGVGAATDAKTAMDVMQAISKGEITAAQATALFPSLANVINAGQTYQGPAYTPVDQGTVQQALQQVQAQSDGAWGGQCGAFVNNYLQDMGLGRMFTDPIDAKKAVKNSSVPVVGGVAIFDYTDNPNASDAQKKYGHVSVITAVDTAKGTMTLKESNKGGEESVFSRTVPINKAFGFFDPTKSPEQQTGSNEIVGSLGIPVSYERSVKNFVPATLMNSEIELKQLNETIKSMHKGGVAEEDAALFFMGFNIKNEDHKPIAKELVSIGRQLPDDMQQSFVKSISDFVNSGNIDGAIKKAELTAMNFAQKQEGSNFISESTVKTATQRSNEIEQSLNNASSSPIGVVSGTMKKWLGKLKGSEAQKIQTQITQTVAQMRNQLLGSAVTPSEAAFLAPLIPDLNDTPENFIMKLNNLKNAPLTQHNNIRTTYGLPQLDSNSLLNMGARKNLYMGGATPTGGATGGATDTRADFDL